MSSDTLNLGQLITTPQQRDAIHIALCPVIAAHGLHSGDRVGLVPGTTNRVAKNEQPHVGIVDPFLKKAVKADQQCWLFLFPNTVTSLRHEWTHPAFKDTPEPKRNISASEQWIRDWAERNEVYYRELMEAAENWVESGEYWCDGGRFEGMHVPDEFWIHYTCVTGRAVKEEDRGSFFTCSC